MDNVALKELRKKLGLSLSRAATLVHVTPRTWARYEAGDRRIPEGVVHLFCIENSIDYESIRSADMMNAARRIAHILSNAARKKK